MSHTITAATSYVLNKYSRSYPSASSLATGTQAPVESEWQHFTNPVMRLVLETIKSPSGQLASMRLRILWSLYTAETNDSHVDQREVVFEDLELLSFSSLPASQVSITHSDQSLPLKAVYRDAVIGIRYLHPRMVAPSSQPTYRRFQITFKDAVDASQCIDAIKPVCPCRANPHPVHISRNSTVPSASLKRAATTVAHPAPMRSIGLMERQSTMSVSVEPRPIPSTMPGQQVGNQACFIAPSSVATSLSSDDSAFVTYSETSHRGLQKDGLPKSRVGDAAQGSLPSSSQTPSVQNTAMPPPPAPRHATADAMTQEPPRAGNTDDERLQLLTSLSKHPSLYELSRTDLEILVSQIIREEGFLHLLESLDSLWRIKGFLGR